MTYYGQLTPRNKGSNYLGNDMENDDFLEMRQTIHNMANAATEIQQLTKTMSSNLGIIDALNMALDKNDRAVGFAPALQGLGSQNLIWFPPNHPMRSKMVEAMKDYYVHENVELYNKITALKDKL